MICYLNTADYDKNRVPASFPGTVGVVEDPDYSGWGSINPDYRKYKDAENEEFYYFVTRILSAVNPTKSNFKQRKDKDLLSEIFSVTDEAFALILIFNEHHVWENQKQRKTNPEIRRRKKRYCDAESGNRDGWMEEGKDLFNELCEKVAKLREDHTTGKELETKMRERFMKESGNYKKHSSSNTTGISNNRPKRKKQSSYIDPALRASLLEDGLGDIPAGSSDGEETEKEEEDLE